MSFEQAYHTCCRNGLTTPTLAFQFQATSSGLDRDQLGAIARTMVGYRPPPSAPRAPSDDELSKFPISLRYLSVPGVGPTVSKTVYVGREDREDAEGGHGRFGNYFSHVVAAVGRAAFDEDRHPIETWGSTAWQTDSAGPAQTLESLPSGPVSAVDALARISDESRQPWLPVIFDALGDALEGRTRLVILDDGDHGWAWIAVIALAIPPVIARELTFDTYTGEPESSGARLSVTDPSIERAGLNRRALSGELHVIDVAGPAPPANSLLGKVVAQCGLASNARWAARDLDELAVLMAADDGNSVAVTDTDISILVRCVTKWLGAGESNARSVAAAAELLDAALDENVGLDGVDRQMLDDLIKAERQNGWCSHTPIASTVTRLMIRLPALSAEVEGVLVSSNEPSSELIGDAIALISESDSSLEDVIRDVNLLERLQLVGVNAALDRRIGRAAARYPTDATIGAWLVRIGYSAGGRIVVESTLKALAKGRPPRDSATLLRLARPPLRDVLTELADTTDDFQLAALRAAADNEANPAERAEHLTHALRLTRDPAEAYGLFRVLYEGAAVDLNTTTDLTSAFLAARIEPQPAMLRLAWAELERADLTDDPTVIELAANLRKLDPHHPSLSIEYAAPLMSRRRMPLDERFAEIETYRRRLNPSHLHGILRRVVRDVGLLPFSERAQHAALIDHGRTTFGDDFFASYTEEVNSNLADTSRAELAASVFYAWYRSAVPVHLYEEMISGFFDKALKRWRQQDRKPVSTLLAFVSPGCARDWEDWCEEFPPAGIVGRAVGRMGRRRQ